MPDYLPVAVALARKCNWGLTWPGGEVKSWLLRNLISEFPISEFSWESFCRDAQMRWGRIGGDVTARAKLQFRFEAFNFFNRVNFGIPDLQVFDRTGRQIPTAGRITSTIGTARQIQLGLKLSF